MRTNRNFSPHHPANGATIEPVALRAARCVCACGRIGMRVRVVLWAIIVASELGHAGQVSAQAKSAPPNVGKSQTVRTDGSFRPSYRIEPLVHRVASRPGRDVNLTFEIESHTIPVQLEMRAVALRQEENGAIQPDIDRPPPENVQLVSTPKVAVAGGQTHKIQVRVRVPSENTTFHSFGVLVKDQGIAQSKPPQDEQEPKSSLGIRFVTQYLLRIDIDVEGIRSEPIRELKLSRGMLIEEDGRCVARVFVENPTNSPIEFTVRAHLTNAAAGLEKPSFKLCLPSRMGMDGPDRYIGKLLPQARVRVEEIVPHALASGSFELKAELLANGRVQNSTAFPVEVLAQDFPRQNVEQVAAAPDVSLWPRQIELSLQKGGSRMVPVQLHNQGARPIEMDLVAEGLDGKPATWFVVRPDKLTLAPKSTRKVMASLMPNVVGNAYQFGRIRATVKAEGRAVIENREVTLALLPRGAMPVTPQVETSGFRFNAESARPQFEWDVTNTATAHLPLTAELTLIDESGRVTRSVAGYGLWCLPGQSQRLNFRIEPPAPGQYRVQAKLDLGDGREPVSVRELIEFAQPSITTAKPTPSE
jgi:hypothetical protein